MQKKKTIKLKKKYKLLYKICYIQKEKKEKEEEVCDDPEIEAWLNGGDKEQSEQEQLEEKPLVDEVNEKDCDDTRCMAVIENQSEVAYHDDGDMCIISDAMIAKMMKNLGKKNHDDLEFEEDEMEDEIKPKKINRNSRAAKKEREERKLEAQKALQEKKEKELEKLKEQVQKPVSKYNYKRPVKKTSSTLQSLALKQKKSQQQASVNEKPAQKKVNEKPTQKKVNENSTQKKVNEKPVQKITPSTTGKNTTQKKPITKSNPSIQKKETEKPKVDIHKIFNRSGSI